MPDKKMDVPLVAATFAWDAFLERNRLEAAALLYFAPGRAHTSVQRALFVEEAGKAWDRVEAAVAAATAQYTEELRAHAALQVQEPTDGPK